MIASTLISRHTDTDVADIDMESLEKAKYTTVTIDNETPPSPTDTNKVCR